MSQHSSEITLLLAACRPEPDNRIDSLLHDLADDIDWMMLIETALKHGVAGLLCDNLLRTDPSLVPDQILDASRVFLDQAAQSNQDAADQLSRILSALETAGIEAIPFKGPALAISAYGRLELRSFRDLDFLIRETLIQPCIDRLREAGYSHDWDLTQRQWQAFVEYGGQDILSGPGLPIEPHWAFAPVTMSWNIDYGALWNRAVRESLNGDTVLRLSPEDELTLLCTHGSKEKWTKLKWVADVAWFIKRQPDIDLPALFSRAESQGLARMVRAGLALAELLLTATLPGVAREWVDKDPKALQLAQKAAIDLFDHPESGKSIYKLSRFHWNMRERPGDRWRYLYRTLSQPRTQHFQDISLPDSLFFLYTPYKIVHDYLLLPAWSRLKRPRKGAGEAPTNPEDIDATG
ncbi:MAG: nucleotidyltransferase family protein [Sedimenticola sp.]